MNFGEHFCMRAIVFLIKCWVSVCSASSSKPHTWGQCFYGTTPILLHWRHQKHLKIIQVVPITVHKQEGNSINLYVFLHFYFVYFYLKLHLEFIKCSLTKRLTPDHFCLLFFPLFIFLGGDLSMTQNTSFRIRFNSFDSKPTCCVINKDLDPPLNFSMVFILFLGLNWV